MSVLKKKGSTCLLVLGLIFSFTLNVGKIVKLPIDYVYGALKCTHEIGHS